MQSEGQGTPRDVQAALAIVGRLCDQKYIEGCTTQGTLLLRSQNPGDVVHGTDLLLTACRSGSTRVCEVVKALPR